MHLISSFSERLEELMSEKEITHKMLSQSLTIDLSLIYKYLRKNYMPSLNNAFKISEYFDCSLNYLMGLCEFEPHVSLYPNGFVGRFKMLLDEKKITRYKLVKATNLNRKSVDEWYQGIRVPSISSLMILADYFDYSIDFLLGCRD